MATLDVGRVCMKNAGREAGKYCVVLKKMDNNFVLVTGPKVLTGVKRRRCNVEHLEPTPLSVKIEVEANDSVVIKAYDAAGVTTKLGLRKPSPEVVKKPGKKVPEKKVDKPKKEEKKPEKIPEKKEKPEVKKVEEKPKEEKKGIKIKFKIPSLRKKKKEEKKPEKKKPEKKPAKKPVKKPKKAAKKAKKKK